MRVYYPSVTADKYEFIVNLSRDFITLINREYMYEVVNDAYCTNIGKSREEILNRSVSEIWGEERFRETIKGYLDQCFEGHEVHYVDRFRFGLSVKYMHISFYPYTDGGTTTHALVYSHDITRLGDIESKLINYEYRDPVTGLFNRKSLDIILDMEIEKAKRSHENLRGLLFISLDNISEINETYGSAIGDVLLENTGLRIKEILRGSDYVFRVEGRELSVIITNIEAETDAARVAQKISSEISIPYSHPDGDIIVRSTVGVAIFPTDGQNREELIRNAVTTMNESRRREVPFMLFDPSVHQRALNRLHLESDMLKAFERKEFALHYQPVVDVRGKIAGAEALIRWFHPERGYVPPFDFIPIAERSGLISSISKWVLFTAARAVAEGFEKRGAYVSVNLSARDFMNDDLIETVENAIRHGNIVDRSRFKVEVTETHCISAPEHAVKQIERLQEIGIDVLIDDFGTGQSSLSYLKQLPASILKIDRSFITGIDRSDADRDFLAGVLELARGRGKAVIIEGVDSAAQVEILLRLGCDRLQGFYFSRAVPAADLYRILDHGGILPIEEP